MVKVLPLLETVLILLSSFAMCMHLVKKSAPMSIAVAIGLLWFVMWYVSVYKLYQRWSQ